MTHGDLQVVQNLGVVVSLRLQLAKDRVLSSDKVFPFEFFTVQVLFQMVHLLL